MSPISQRFWCVVTAMLVLLVSVRTAVAEDHVVPLRELQQEIRTAAEQRDRNAADIERVLSYPAAKAELARYNINAKQVHHAVATLTNEELARLADRARSVENDVQGGLIVGLLALIGLIVVIIIVVSLVSEAMPPSPADGGVEGWSPAAQIAPVNG